MEAIPATPRAPAARHDPGPAPVRYRWDGLEELRPALHRYLARRCRDEGEVDDVVQETFLRAARYRGSLAQPQKLQGWALRIALNVLRDQRRREEPALVAEGPEDALGEVAERPDGFPAAGTSLGALAGADEPDGDLRLGRYLVPREVALRGLRTVLSGLRCDERRMLDAYYAPGGGPDLAARELALPRDLVKVRVFRLRRRLNGMLRRRFALAGRGWSER